MKGGVLSSKSSRLFVETKNDREKAICNLLSEGYSMADIGRQQGVSRQRIHEIVQGIRERSFTW